MCSPLSITKSGKSFIALSRTPCANQMVHASTSLTIASTSWSLPREPLTSWTNSRTLRLVSPLRINLVSNTPMCWLVTRMKSLKWSSCSRKDAIIPLFLRTCLPSLDLLLGLDQLWAVSRDLFTNSRLRKAYCNRMSARKSPWSTFPLLSSSMQSMSTASSMSGRRTTPTMQSSYSSRISLRVERTPRRRPRPTMSTSLLSLRLLSEKLSSSTALARKFLRQLSTLLYRRKTIWGM